MKTNQLKTLALLAALLGKPASEEEMQESFRNGDLEERKRCLDAFNETVEELIAKKDWSGVSHASQQLHKILGDREAKLLLDEANEAWAIRFQRAVKRLRNDEGRLNRLDFSEMEKPDKDTCDCPGCTLRRKREADEAASGDSAFEQVLRKELEEMFPGMKITTL